MNAIVLPVPHDEQELAVRAGWQMKELKPWHKQMCSMLAQGIPRGTIASILDCTPEYISMLSKQPLVVGYIREMCQYAGLQLESQFVQAVEAIGDTLANGNHKEKMQAARLQMEATKRIGSGSNIPQEVIDTATRLERLANRLMTLNTYSHNEQIIEGEYSEHANLSNMQDGANGFGQSAHESTQADGNGTSAQPTKEGTGHQGTLF